MPAGFPAAAPPAWRLFDTHAHLDQAEFSADLPAAIQRAQAAGVARILAVGVTAASSEQCLSLARSHDCLRAAAGIHPNYAGEVAADEWDRILQLARDPLAVALGETGLDRYRDDTPWPVQQANFDRHLRLSQEIDKPFIVHSRQCDLEILEMLREARLRGPLRGIMHSFTGEAAVAAECVALGLHVSFAGMLTFKKSGGLRAVAAAVPLDRLLVETDSPYLSPEPLRGKRNEPANVARTAECLAAARGMPLAELAAATFANACRLFGWPE